MNDKKKIGKIGRNDPCPCGSGKKFKRCCKTIETPKRDKRSKPRVEIIRSTTATPVDSLSVIVNPATMEFEFPSPMKNTRSTVSYSRKKGPKVLSSVPVESNTVQMKPNSAMTKNYDLLFAIDTNKRTFRNFSVCVSGIIEIRVLDDPTLFHYMASMCYLFVGLESGFEQFAWGQLILDLLSSPKYDENLRIGLIVDCDLEKISAYNDGTLLVNDRTALPRNVKLIYASSDAGSELMANSMIRKADKLSARLLNSIVTEDSPTLNSIVESLIQNGQGIKRLLDPDNPSRFFTQFTGSEIPGTQ